MIHVKRIAKPKALVDNELKWKVAFEATIDAKTRKKVAERYRHKTIQLALSAMFSGKCAYCESKIELVSDAHIEHYRPKSRFPELTFDWKNLLWACGKCNSTKHKGDKFPDETDDGPILNPCEDDPDEHLTFD